MTGHQNVVIWLDPGQTTGLALWDESTQSFFSGQYNTGDLVECLTAAMEKYPDRLVVGYEAYLAAGGPRAGTSKHSQEAIGVVKEFAKSSGCPLLAPVPSSSRKVGSKVFLQRLGWYKPGKRHANDAAQHLLSHLLTQKPMSPHVRSKLFPGYTTGARVTT